MLYYFTSQLHGLEAIRDQRLKISNTEALNDPFEYSLLSLPALERRIMLKSRQRMANKAGLISFCKTWQHPLLWAHYADNHKGIALGFKVLEEDLFVPIKYVDHRKTLKSMDIKGLADLTEQQMLEIVSTKYSAWSYETEVRCFCKMEDRDPISGLYFRDFSPALQLTEVFVGFRATVSRSALRQVLGMDSAKVQSKKVRPAFHSFEMVENKRTRSWKE